MQSSVYFCDNFNTPTAIATATAAAVNNRFSTSSYLCISKQMLCPPGIALVCIFLPPIPTTTTTNKWQMQTIVMRRKQEETFLF